MSQLINYTCCPICNNSTIAKVLTAKDNTVSNELFDIWHCNYCTARFTQNVANANNIGAYYQSNAYVSHSDTKEGVINKLYHFVRNITLKSKRKLILKQVEQATGVLLDIGAGTGAFANTMQQANWLVTALEPDENAAKIAKEKFSINLQPIHNLFTLNQNQFDVITMWHVLEHVHDLHKYLQQFFYLLKPNGKIFIAVPNYTSYDATQYNQHWAAYDVPRHLYHFSPNSINILAKANGFKVVNHKPMWFDSFYVSMLSEQYKTGSNNFFKAFLVGLVSNVYTIFSKQKCSSIIYVLEKQPN